MALCGGRLPIHLLQRIELYGAQGRLLREQHERKIHFLCRRQRHKKLVGAVPAESVPGAQYNGLGAKIILLQRVTPHSVAERISFFK